MKSSDGEFQKHDDLEWISVRENISSKNLKSKGIFGILVPVGCIVTSGILALGIYNMFKKNSKKQQILMRYRVLAQGITIAIAAIGIFRQGMHN